MGYALAVASMAARAVHLVLKAFRYTYMIWGSQSCWHTVLLLSCTSFPQFLVSASSSIIISLFQSYVSPFPYGTFSLLVLSKSSALDQMYHPLHTPMPRDVTQRRCTMHGGMQMIDRRITLAHAIFQRPIAAPPLVPHLSTTIWSNGPQFQHWVSPCAFAITKDVLVSLSSTTYLYA